MQKLYLNIIFKVKPLTFRLLTMFHFSSRWKLESWALPIWVFSLFNSRKEWQLGFHVEFKFSHRENVWMCQEWRWIFMHLNWGCHGGAGLIFCQGFATSLCSWHYVKFPQLHLQVFWSHRDGFAELFEGEPGAAQENQPYHWVSTKSTQGPVPQELKQQGWVSEGGATFTQLWVVTVFYILPGAMKRKHRNSYLCWKMSFL